MKQFITIKEASNQLTKINYRTLVEWLDDKKYIDRYYDTGDEVLMTVGIPFTKNKQGGDYAFMTIGQMIEFLSDKTCLISIEKSDREDLCSWQIFDHLDVLFNRDVDYIEKTELCDALWEAVKEVLNK